MKTQIAVGAALLLSLSTAIAGTLMYAWEPVVQTREVAVTAPAITAEAPVTPQMLAMWAATADSDYIAPKVPI